MRGPAAMIGTVTAEPRGVDLVKFRRHAELVVVVAIKLSSVCIFVSFLRFNFSVTMFISRFCLLLCRHRWEVVE